MLVFDIESDGLLDTISKVHCINMIDRETGEESRYTDHEFYQDVDGSVTDVAVPRAGNIAQGLVRLQQAELIAGHNIIGYDLPALSLVYPDFVTTAKCYDSTVASQLIYPDLEDIDYRRMRNGKLSEDFKKFAGRHSLAAWGARLDSGESKSDFNPSDYGHTWATMTFTSEMDEYCMQDVRANVTLIEKLESKNYSEQALDIEMGVSKIISLQERTGMPFDSKGADDLAETLYARQYVLGQECREVFPPFYKRDGATKMYSKAMKRWVDSEHGAHVHPKDSERAGYYEYCSPDAERQPVKLVEFNPGSSAHISRCLTQHFGWEPSEFTATDLPKIDATILEGLPFPEAAKIAEYMMVTKRLSQLCEGDQAWMKKVKSDGRIYGRVNQLGTVTGRMSHSGPNLAQVPRSGSPFGIECRSLFTAEEGKVIVGCDADALEARVLAHFMAAFDGGAYIDTVLNGNKEDGTDVHTLNKNSLGLEKRDTAKTWFYAMLYGSGNHNLGVVTMSEWSPEKTLRFYAKFPPGDSRKRKIAAIGAKGRRAVMVGLPALKKLLDKVGEAAGRGYLRGLDRRKIPVRSAHAALNSLCQSAGAVVMKQALVLMFEEYDSRGLDVLPLLNVHDEVQLSCSKEISEEVGQIAAQSIADAGVVFNFKCPLGGDFDIGLSWAETH